MLQTGKQNQGVSQFGLSAKYGNTKLSFDYSDMAYTKQKVVVAGVQSDGSYYNNDFSATMFMPFAWSTQISIGCLHCCLKFHTR